MSGDDKPDPLTTPDMDVRDLDGFMFNVERLLASELWALANGDEFKAAVGLWCRAWKQIPAGSLPNDDRVLASFSGAGARWRKVKDMALRGFVLCSDGRLYHRVLCEDVHRAWARKVEFNEEKQGIADRKRREREERARMFADLSAVGVTPLWNITTGALRDLVAKHVTGKVTRPVTEERPPVTPPVTVTVTATTVQDRTGQKEERSVEAASTASARPPAEQVCEALGVSLTATLERIQWPAEIRKWLESGNHLDDLLAACKREKERGNANKPLKWLLRCADDFKAVRIQADAQKAEGIRKERFLWLDVYAMDGRWNSGLGVGPAPHEPGTLVTDEELDRVRNARAMRDKLLARAAPPKAAVEGQAWAH